MNRVDDDDETDDDGGEMGDYADGNENEEESDDEDEEGEEEDENEIIDQGNEENTCVITEVGKTKKMTYNLCLWLEQLHALGAWLDHGSI